MQSHQERYVALEGSFNFRDLGGYLGSDGRRIVPGRLFRSDTLHALTDSDVRTVRDRLGLAAIVDLRSELEALETGCPQPVFEGLAYRRIPLILGGQAELSEKAESMSERYLGILDFSRDRVREVVEVLATSASPTVFHCAAGKDRTGVISAVVLGILGVSDGDIIEDYSQSAQHIQRIWDRLMTMGYREALENAPPELMSATPETMLSLLDAIADRWDSVEGYTDWCGIDQSTRERLRAYLLEPA